MHIIFFFHRCFVCKWANGNGNDSIDDNNGKNKKKAKGLLINARALVSFCFVFFIF